LFLLFHRGESHLTGVNGDGKIIYLCALSAFSEAGGEYTHLSALQSKWSFVLCQDILLILTASSNQLSSIQHHEQ
jgi:hypothetical protein